jgi:carbon monoxide dehydrogenase subunit G
VPEEVVQVAGEALALVGDRPPRELLPGPAKRRLDMKISGGGVGSAVDLTSGADLVDAGDGTTLLKWSGQVEARGPIAAVGGRVLDAQAQKLIAQAFSNVRQQLTA